MSLPPAADAMCAVLQDIVGTDFDQVSRLLLMQGCFETIKGFLLLI